MQEKEQGMHARYESAQRLVQAAYGAKTTALNTTIFPVWIGDANSFWYVRDNWEGKEFRLVDAAATTNEPAFNHKALAASLAKATGETADPENLAITDVEITLEPVAVLFNAFDKRWRFDQATNSCAEVEKPSRHEIVSPDRRHLVFMKDFDLWLRDRESGEERALTTDGEELNAYGALSTGWGGPNGVPDMQGLQVIWSSDSKRVFVVQCDTRKVKVLPTIHHVPKEGMRPVLAEVRVAYPGDEGIEEVRLVSIDIATGRIVEADYGQIPTTRNGYGFFSSHLGWWGKDSRLAYFVDVDRYYKYAKVVEFDTETGACRVLFEETSDTQVNLMLNQDAYQSYLPLPETDEILWFSERTGWAHFYLYDLKTGELKNAVTSGPGLARNIVRYIPQRREVFVQMAGQVQGRDPYYRNLVRVNLDTGEMTVVADSDHEYVVLSDPQDCLTLMLCFMGASLAACGVSPRGEYAVVTRSRADEAPVSYLVGRDGEKLMDIEAADISRLPEGWQWPEPVKLLAADGKTDIYGLIFRPSDFDPNKSYPVISHGFNQPEVSWVPKGSFANGVFAGHSYTDAAALAELGFIVVQIDGRGSPEREKAFFDHCYGWFEKASDIDDHAAGIRQLAERYPYMDLSRVGIAAYANGGSGALQGLLKHPDLFKLGVTCAYHDRRLMPAQMQGEKYEGSGVFEGVHEYPEDYISRLQGRLLLMVGMLDTSTPPAATFRLIEALRKANKDFDMIMLPNLGHEPSLYLTRRAWDYLVRHLLGAEPPKAFNLSFTEHFAQKMDE